MDLFPARIAPHVDRLVLGINRQVGPRHGHVLGAIATELGLDSLKMIPHFADFWLDGPLRSDVLAARLPYAPMWSVTERLGTFVSRGLVERSDAATHATGAFRPLLVAAIAAREDVVDRTWSHTPTDDIEALTRRVVDAVTESHIVACAHRSLTPAENPMLRLYDRLVTLRYVRQHDHVEAWHAEGLSADAMKVLTPLWYREAPPLDGPGWEELEVGGLVEEGRLTDRGRSLREQIEVETNQRAASSWSVLDEAEREHLLAVLSEMPSDPVPGH